jgi:hypothetical protein
MSYHSTSTFRTLGSAAASQPLFTIVNGHASKVIRIRSIEFYEDATAVLTAVTSQIKVSRGTSISGGTVLSKVDWDTAAASDALVVCRGNTASDGGATTTLLATIANVLWQSFIMRVHTVVGQIIGHEVDVIPSMCENSPILLRPSEGLSVHIINPTAASNAATNHYLVSCSWTEDAS